MMEISSVFDGRLLETKDYYRYICLLMALLLLSCNLLPQNPDEQSLVTATAGHGVPTTTATTEALPTSTPPQTPFPERVNPVSNEIYVDVTLHGSVSVRCGVLDFDLGGNGSISPTAGGIPLNEVNTINGDGVMGKKFEYLTADGRTEVTTIASQKRPNGVYQFTVSGQGCEPQRID